MAQILQGEKMSNLATKPKFALAALIGLIAGVVSAFVKWGAEVPLPPRSPMDMFNAACGPESAIRAADAIDCSRNFLNPPLCVFKRLCRYRRSKRCYLRVCRACL